MGGKAKYTGAAQVNNAGGGRGHLENILPALTSVAGWGEKRLKKDFFVEMNSVYPETGSDTPVCCPILPTYLVQCQGSFFLLQ